MPEPPTLICTVAPHPQREAITYTLRLLASLIGHRVLIHETDSPADTDLYYGTDRSVAASARLWIHPETRFWSCIPPAPGVTPDSSREWQGAVFPVWQPSAAPADEAVDYTTTPCPVDPIAAAFFLVSRAEEYVARRRDSHGRFRADDAWMCRNRLHYRPLVHDYARALATALGRPEIDTAAWPDDGRFAIAFTHDIDRLRMHGPMWLDVLRGLSAILGGGGAGNLTRRMASRWVVRTRGHRDPYDILDDMIRRHGEYGFRATFFWIATSPSHRDADYAIGNPVIAEYLRQLHEGGHECGLHGSYDSLNDRRRLEQERAALAASADTPIRAIRQHYLRFTAPETWQVQADAGFTIDSTLGFAEQFGFRCGLAVPFRPWSFAANAALDIWEVPLVMMEVSAKEYMWLKPDEAAARSRALIAHLAAVGGGAAVLWHNSSLNDIDWNGWGPVYEAWLDATRQHGGRGLTLTDLVESWQAHLAHLGLA